VDSNVFIRSVLLSLDYFKRSQLDTMELVSSPFLCSLEETSIRKCDFSFGNKEDGTYYKITAFISHNTLWLLKDLMCAVRLDDINQVCFITFLIFSQVIQLILSLSTGSLLLCALGSIFNSAVTSLLSYLIGCWMFKVEDTICVSLSI